MYKILNKFIVWTVDMYSLEFMYQVFVWGKFESSRLSFRFLRDFLPKENLNKERVIVMIDSIYSVLSSLRWLSKKG